MKVTCILWDVGFLRHLPLRLLLHSITQSGTVISNVDSYRVMFALVSLSLQTTLLHLLLFPFLRIITVYPRYTNVRQTQHHQL
jgi:hypothetical protein